jgi:plastocyanin
MSKRIAFCLLIISVGIASGSIEPRAARATDAGSINGHVTASGVRNTEDVVVYIETVAREEKPPTDPVVMDQKKMTFVPRVLPVVKGTTVRFQNSDPVMHNVSWYSSNDGSYSSMNLGTWARGGANTYRFDRLGYVQLLCDIHPEMEAYIVVLQNSFFAVVRKDGSYEIKNVPPGQYTVKTWYPNTKKLKSKAANVRVEAGTSVRQDFMLGKS